MSRELHLRTWTSEEHRPMAEAGLLAAHVLKVYDLATASGYARRANCRPGEPAIPPSVDRLAVRVVEALIADQ